MAAIGVTDTTNISSEDGLSDIYPMIQSMPSGVPSAATLDSVEIYLHPYSSTDVRVGVFSGGTSDSNASGASLIWDSGRVSTTSGALQWFVVTAGGESLPASTRLWVAIRSHADVYWTVAPTDGSEDGDFSGSTYYYHSGVSGGDLDTAWDSTAPTSGSARHTDPYKIILNYTESAGGASSTLALLGVG